MFLLFNNNPTSPMTFSSIDNFSLKIQIFLIWHQKPLIDNRTKILNIYHLVYIIVKQLIIKYTHSETWKLTCVNGPPLIIIIAEKSISHYIVCIELKDVWCGHNEWHVSHRKNNTKHYQSSVKKHLHRTLLIMFMWLNLNI